MPKNPYVPGIHKPKKARWNSPVEIKAIYRSVNILSNNRVFPSNSHI